MGQVIRMDQVSRPELSSFREEAELKGYLQALEDLAFVKPCNTPQTLTAFENWLACGRLTQAQYDGLMQFHGWRRE